LAVILKTKVADLWYFFY